MNTIRNYKIDNFRAILIFLVVLGHFYENINFLSSDFQYLIIYSFHMPAFVFVSGLCFKNNSIKKLLKTILLPYVLFQFIFSLDSISNLQFTTPFWALWYLLSLFIWCLVTKLIPLKRNLYIIILSVAFIMSILIGYSTNIGYFLSLSRTIAYFPFFLLGVYIKNFREDFLKATHKNSFKLISLSLIVVSVILLFIFKNNISVSWLYNSESYTQSLSSPIIRIFNFYVAIIFIWFFIIHLPNKKLRLLTHIGQNTMPIYILHMFIVILLENSMGIFLFPIITIPILAFICTVVFSLKSISRIFSKFIIYDKLFKKNLN